MAAVPTCAPTSVGAGAHAPRAGSPVAAAPQHCRALRCKLVHGSFPRSSITTSGRVEATSSCTTGANTHGVSSRRCPVHLGPAFTRVTREAVRPRPNAPPATAHPCAVAGCSSWSPWRRQGYGWPCSLRLGQAASWITRIQSPSRCRSCPARPSRCGACTVQRCPAPGAGPAASAATAGAPCCFSTPCGFALVAGRGVWVRTNARRLGQPEHQASPPAQAAPPAKARARAQSAAESGACGRARGVAFTAAKAAGCAIGCSGSPTRVEVGKSDTRVSPQPAARLHAHAKSEACEPPTSHQRP